MLGADCGYDGVGFDPSNETLKSVYMTGFISVVAGVVSSIS